MFKAIVYTTQTDQLRFKVVLAAEWTKQYERLFKSGKNLDQATWFHNETYPTAKDAETAAKTWMQRWGAMPA